MHGSIKKIAISCACRAADPVAVSLERTTDQDVCSSAPVFIHESVCATQVKELRTLVPQLAAQRPGSTISDFYLWLDYSCVDQSNPSHGVQVCQRRKQVSRELGSWVPLEQYPTVLTLDVC